MKQRTQTLGKGAVKVNQKETCPDANVGIILKETRLAKKLSWMTFQKPFALQNHFFNALKMSRKHFPLMFIPLVF